MKLTNAVYDTDRVEIPIYVNGSFAEKIVLTGKEVNRLLTLLQEPLEVPNGSIVVPATQEVKIEQPADTTRLQVDGTDGKNLESTTGTAKYDPKDATFTNKEVPTTLTAGEAVSEVRKEGEEKAGDEAVETREDK